MWNKLLEKVWDPECGMCHKGAQAGNVPNVTILKWQLALHRIVYFIFPQSLDS